MKQLFVLHLQISDDGVLHILFLFLQKVITHSIQCVRAQFVVPKENLRETHNCSVALSGKNPTKANHMPTLL